MLNQALTRIEALLPATHAPLVGISGIDSSGKGFVTRLLEEELTAKGLRVANLNVDRWLNPPAIRFSDQTPAETFYTQGIRLDEMFTQLILPLRDNRQVHITAQLIAELDAATHPEPLDYAEIDLILLEGIFLFQPRFLPHFDLTCWIECSFENALARAIQRSQEGLPPADTIAAFERIYFPAQRLHFERDAPQAKADLTILNEEPLAK